MAMGVLMRITMDAKQIKRACEEFMQRQLANPQSEVSAKVPDDWGIQIIVSKPSLNEKGERMNTGGSAFPVNPSLSGPGGSRSMDAQTGMTLRDYFAAAALQGMLSNPDWLRTLDASLDGTGGRMRDVIAEATYSIADVMIAERAK